VWNPASSFGAFTNAGLIWGTIGPSRFFGIGSPYAPLLCGFLIGLILPAIPWLLNKAYPNPRWKLINIPLFATTMRIASNQAAVVVPFFLNFIFNKVIYERKRDWWNRYNFILAIALESATAISLLVITLVQFNPSLSVPFGPLSPNATVDYYCLEQRYDGSAL